MVWSETGRARWEKSSTEFYRWIRMGELSRETFAYDAFRGEAVPNKLESVPARAWLFEKGLKADARILEHSTSLPSFDAVLTILVIPEQIEEWSDADRRLELDPKEFTYGRSRWPR